MGPPSACVTMEKSQVPRSACGTEPIHGLVAKPQFYAHHAPELVAVSRWGLPIFCSYSCGGMSLGSPHVSPFPHIPRAPLSRTQRIVRTWAHCGVSAIRMVESIQHVWPSAMLSGPGSGGISHRTCQRCVFNAPQLGCTLPSSASGQAH